MNDPSNAMNSVDYWIIVVVSSFAPANRTEIRYDREPLPISFPLCGKSATFQASMAPASWAASIFLGVDLVFAGAGWIGLGWA
jgi:hypothetical protein